MALSEVLKLFFLRRDDLFQDQFVVMGTVGMLGHEVFHPV